MQFNLSKWALENRSLVAYMMIAATIIGLASFYRLGRDEDPPFVIKTMVVQAAWPGATLEDTLQQVTDRLERTLQETPSLDFLRSYTSPGLTTIFVNLKGETRAAQIPSIWYDVRTNVGDMRHTLPDGVIGPGFNDSFGDVFGLIYGITADGFTHRRGRAGRNTRTSVRPSDKTRTSPSLASGRKSAALRQETSASRPLPLASS